MHDLVLSSGFLAFARQCGFLQAVEEVGLPVGGLVGTSSGAICGAMWAAGMSSREIAAELSSRTPLSHCTAHAAVWRGLFRMDGIVERLSQLLPAKIEDLQRPFGIGVAVGPRHRLITRGPLAEAVAASASIPRLFVPITIDGDACSDGAFVDRTALSPWRAHRGGPPVVVHLVERTSGTEDESPLAGLPVVRTPRSRAKLWDLGDFAAQQAEAYRLALPVLEGVAAEAG